MIESFKFTHIEVPNDANIIGIQMSGGADSSLAAYLYAYTIKKHNLPIKLKRMTFGFGNKPDYFQTVRIIQNSITELLQVDLWESPYEIFYAHKAEHSVKKHIELLYNLHNVNYFVNGRTKNPSLSEVSDESNSRISERDNPIRIEFKEMLEPFYNITKEVLIKQYIDLEIFENLFQKTNSCDANIDTALFPCGQCWWCRERNWALEKVFNNGKYTSKN